MSVQPLESLVHRVPPTGATEAADRAYATEAADGAYIIAVIRKPPFQGHGVDGGTDTDGEADAPEGIHRNRKTSGCRGDGWVEYFYLATFHGLVKE